MKNRKKMITLVAVITAIIGAAVAVGTFLKRNAKSLSEKLDYDGRLYYEDDIPEEYEDLSDNITDEEEDLSESFAEEPIE